jgi:hypothetical protein
MSYPQPTKALWPEKPNRSLPPRVTRTSSPDEFVPYPPPTTGRGIPVKFAPLSPISIDAGDTHQIIAALVDVEDHLITPTEKLRYTSNNPKIHVSDGGLVTTNVPPTLVSRRGASEHGTIQIVHGGLSTLTSVTVRTDPNDLVSD